MNFTYDDAVKVLTSQEKFHIKLGLERIRQILNLLGNPQDYLKYIHVAGTNGKGSVCAIIASILQKDGHKTGLYTSPHIFKYTERIKINSQNISDEDFARYIDEISSVAEKNNIYLTEFEILTAVMFKYFYDNNVEIVVLETGLGGRFDATNVIKNNLCSVITHIDYDHTERLGNTLDEIAYEKAGIIKKGCPVICAEGYEAVKTKADKENSLLILVSPCEDTKYLSLKGTFQKENLSLALAAVRLIMPNISDNTIISGLKSVYHPCRFQYIKEKNLITDACHNPNGINALKESLDLYFPNSQKRFVFGCLRNKDYKKMINTLFSDGDEIYFYHFNNKNSCTFNELQMSCKFAAKEFKPSPAFWDKKDKLTVICGSFYMLNEIISEELIR